MWLSEIKNIERGGTFCKELLKSIDFDTPLENIQHMSKRIELNRKYPPAVKVPTFGTVYCLEVDVEVIKNKLTVVEKVNVFYFKYSYDRMCLLCLQYYKRTNYRRAILLGFVILVPAAKCYLPKTEKPVFRQFGFSSFAQ